MHRDLLLSTFLLTLVAPSGAALAAPESKTRAWEKLVIPMLRETFCKEKGTMIELFKITPKACAKTYDYAAKHCLASLQRLPFYAVHDRKTGELWGRMLGSCIGVAYDLKYSNQTPIP